MDGDSGDSKKKRNTDNDFPNLHNNCEGGKCFKKTENYGTVVIGLLYGVIPRPNLFGHQVPNKLKD